MCSSRCAADPRGAVQGPGDDGDGRESTWDRVVDCDLTVAIVPPHHSDGRRRRPRSGRQTVTDQVDVAVWPEVSVTV